VSNPGNDGYYEAYWPRTPLQIGIKQLAPRLSSLEGKTIAYIWDYILKGDEVFTYLGEGLKARYPGLRFVGWDEFGNIHGRNESEVVAALPQLLKQYDVDAVICGMAC
jgi:hypothetical protein